ncbi:MAG: hypothetical protein ABI162_16580 [Luteolibacter sp.]
MATRNSTIRLGVATAILAVLSSGCDKSGNDAAWWQGEQLRLQLSRDLELKEYRFQQSAGNDLPEFEKLRASNKAGKLRLQKLVEMRALLSDEVESTQQQFAAMQKHFIESQRQKAVGQKFKVLNSSSGRQYQDVAVVSVDDSGVAIRHADGTARLRYADLDAKQRAFFGLEEGSALAAENEERVQAAAYERWIDANVAINQEKQTRAAELASRDTQQAKRSRNLMASRQTASANVSALGQPSRSFGGYSGHYLSYRSSPSYRYVYYYNPSSYRASNYCTYYGSLETIRRARGDTPGATPTITAPVTTPKKSFSDTTIPYIP